MNSMQGHLLVASPHLPDPNFYRSVVLIVEHTEEHAFGLVLNRPGESRLCEIWSKISGTACESDQPIRIGGPLEGPLMAVHTQAEHSEKEILPGLHFATKRDNLYAVVAHHHPFAIFAGYSGWSPGQLDSELQHGGWMTLPATRQRVFADTEDLWRMLARTIGGDILRSSLRVQGLPDDPTCN
jgi:putative transcriptional regulator